MKEKLICPICQVDKTLIGKPFNRRGLSLHIWKSHGSQDVVVPPDPGPDPGPLVKGKRVKKPPAPEIRIIKYGQDGSVLVIVPDKRGARLILGYFVNMEIIKQ